MASTDRPGMPPTGTESQPGASGGGGAAAKVVEAAKVVDAVEAGAAPPSTRPDTPAVRLAGGLAVAALKAVQVLPIPAARFCLAPLLPLYRRLRGGHGARLRARFDASPFATKLDAPEYYRTRLDLMLRNLRSHGAPVTRGFPCFREEGREAYFQALAAGRPVVLLGLHAGPFELLHRLPPRPAGRPFLVLTAPAFSPPLTAFMARGRETGGKGILWTGGRGGRSLDAGLRACLEAGGVLALMVDQHPEPGSDGEWLHLWDRLRVPYPGRLLRFLESRGCLFVPISARMDGACAVVRYQGPWGTAPAAWIRDFLEKSVAAAPGQWNWSYPKASPEA